MGRKSEQHTYVIDMRMRYEPCTNISPLVGSDVLNAVFQIRPQSVCLLHIQDALYGALYIQKTFDSDVYDITESLLHD